jgi:hypothetical protein
MRRLVLSSGHGVTLRRPRSPYEDRLRGQVAQPRRHGGGPPGAAPNLRDVGPAPWLVGFSTGRGNARKKEKIDIVLCH